ncbi:MAG: HAMP domain-containing histidine kinase [Lachnospiraceae bacterium]|nr:HAMP domain-containing histidine kinase [Lachnospiraceae bacterium]
MFLIAVLFFFWFYRFFIQGKFAEWMVSVLEYVLWLDYDAAYNLYQQTFRNNEEWFILLFIVLVFLVLLRFYLGWFTGYFEEINNRLDVLIGKKNGEISLSQELYPIERKMTQLQYTMEKQKNDMRVSEQRKNDLVMYLAHDLKTLLASVIGYLNLLRDEGQISEELREKYLSISLDKAEHLENLINEFFEIARYNLSNITLQCSKINLSRLLEQLAYEFEPMLREKELTLALEAGDDILLSCDADKLQRVFDNLLRNAVLYSFCGTEIKITAELQKYALLVKVINHGDTIPKEKLERLFEQFYRLDTARSTDSGCAGLGLAIAKQIVELHNGTITARSEADLIEFTVTFPLSQENSEQENNLRESILQEKLS